MAAGTMMSRPGSRGASFIEADDKGHVEEDMETSGWGGADDNDVIVHNGGLLLACKEWSTSCGV